MTAPRKPAAYRLWWRLRCPETYYVTVRGDAVGLIWPVRHRVKCVRWRHHRGLCRSGVALDWATTNRPTQSWAAVEWAKPLGWWGTKMLDAPWREPARRVRAKLRAGRRAGPRRRSSPPQ